MNYGRLTKKTESIRFFVRAFVCLQRAFQNPSILVFETLSERPRQIELSRLNSFLACSRAKNKNFSIYLLKPLHRQKIKENFFCREIEWTAFRETASFKTRSYENLFYLPVSVVGKKLRGKNSAR